MQRDEVKRAIPLRLLPGADERATIAQELPHPRQPAPTAGASRQSHLDASLAQRLDIADPDLRRHRGVDVGATHVGRAIWFVEGHDVGDVGALGDEALHGGEEGGVGGVGGRAPEHGDEFEDGLGEVVVDDGGGGAVVVVPGEGGGRTRPDVIVFAVVCVGSEDQPALGVGRGCDGWGGQRQEGGEPGEG